MKGGIFIDGACADALTRDKVLVHTRHGTLRWGKSCFLEISRIHRNQIKHFDIIRFYVKPPEEFNIFKLVGREKVHDIVKFFYDSCVESK